eukprot:s447_g10.t1
MNIAVLPVIPCDDVILCLLYGAASLGLVEERFLKEAQQEVASRRLDGVELAGIFWSLSVLSSAPEPLRWEAASRAAELSPQGLANVAWACALQARDAWATAGFVAAVKSHLNEFSPQGLVNLAWSWTEMEEVMHRETDQEGDLLGKILLMAMERTEDLKAMEFSSLLCSLAKRRRSAAAGSAASLELSGGVVRQMVERLEEFDARQVANLSWALAILQPDMEGGVAGRLAAAAMERMLECSAQGLSNLAWAFGCLEVQGPIFTVLAREAVGKMQHSTERFQSTLQAANYGSGQTESAAMMPSDARYSAWRFRESGIGVTSAERSLLPTGDAGYPRHSCELPWIRVRLKSRLIPELRRFDGNDLKTI